MNSPLNNKLPTLTRAQASALVGDYNYRKKAAKTLFGFCITYLNHYFNLNPAIFHRELIEKLGDDKEHMLLILGFRGSAKSTFGSLALPLWAALEKKYQFILPIADTTLQAKVNIANIRYELETNELIRNDYGDMQSDEEWQKENILLANGVRILARSRGQKVRGLRHRQYRPELVVVDDPEDLEWVRTKENRDKTERWLRAEVIPALNERIGKLVLIGNQLHMDALLSRMKGDKGFSVLEYPLIDDQEHCLWPAKYPTKESLDIQRDKAGPTSWQREYLLRIVPEEGQEVLPEEIVYYDMPGKEVSIYGTGLDYAISKKETADYTAAVTGALSFDEKGDAHIDVMPHPLNERIDMRETIESVKLLHNQYYKNQITFAEEVAYQKAANDEIERAGLPIERIHPSKDKRARLRIAATYIKNGMVRFPRRGCEDLLIQLFGFGSEEHDDLVDALVYMILGLVESGLKMEEVIAI